MGAQCVCAGAQRPGGRPQPSAAVCGRWRQRSNGAAGGRVVAGLQGPEDERHLVPAALAKIDVAADGVEDLRKKLGAITYANAWDRTKRAMLAKYMKDPKECALWLGYFDRLISGSESGFVAGSADASHADYLLLDLLDHHVAPVDLA